MQMITSAAGTRLARAKVERDAMQLEHSSGGDCWPALRDARHEFHRAAQALADELVASGYHDLDGES